MSSLQVFVRLGIKKWARILPPLRNGAVTSQKIKTIILPESTTTCCFSSEEGNKAYKLKKREELRSLALSKEDDGNNENKHIENKDRVADEIITHSKQILSNSLSKSCEYLLTEWGRQIKVAQKAVSEIDHKMIISRKLPEMVNFILSPSAPVNLRHKCLALLLSEKTDEELTCKMLNQTVEDASYLPVQVLADIVNTLTTSYVTPLRKDTRIKLVTAIINQRWYEVPPKYLVLFMYQMDELFDMKKVAKQQRQKNRQENSSFELEVELNNILNAGKDVGFEGKEESSIQPGVVVAGNASTPIKCINLETQAISVANNLKIKDLARIIILLAKWQNRNEILLNTMVHCLSQADLSVFSFVQLNNLLFSFSVLNFHEHEILGKISFHLAQMTPTSPALACASLASLSHLRWNDKVLISKYLRFLADHISELTVKDAQSVLMSLANLYAVPSDETETNLVLNLASRVFSGNVSLMDRVNCAWSLAIIISLGTELGESLLQPEFVNQISKDKDIDDFQKEASLQKLSSINTAFKYEVKGYSGPLLSDEQLNPTRHCQAGHTDKALHSELKNTLKKFVGLKAYTSFGETIKGGVTADAVMSANSSGEIRPIHQTDDSNKVYKLAIQLIPFSGVLNLSQSPTGAYCMTSRHLKHLRYVPVQILYSDLKPSKSALEKINNLKAKIKAAVTEFSAAE